jgi:hypothetical protein
MTRPKLAWPDLRPSLLPLLLLAQATATLAQPIVAFSGKDSDSPDELAFVALTDLSAGTQFYVTNNDWDNTAGIFSNSGEGTLLFTVSATIPHGTVTQVSETSDNTFTVTGGAGTATFVAGADWTPSAADPHYAFTTTNAVSPLTNVDQIFALMLTQLAAPAETDPTTGMNASPNAIVVDFTATRIIATNATLANAANFYADDGTITLSLTGFFGVGLVFFDDFESGDTTAWSSVSP